MNRVIAYLIIILLCFHPLYGNNFLRINSNKIEYNNSIKIYYINSITWSGNSVFSDKYLNNILNIKKGSIVNNINIIEAINNIINMYQYKGYYFTKIQHIVNYNNNKINLFFNITEGNKSYINKIIIKGDHNININIINKLLYTFVGALYDYNDIVKTVNNLQNTDLFDNDNIAVSIIPNDILQCIDIEYLLHKKKHYKLKLSGGIENLYIVYNVVLNFNNFSIRKILNIKSENYNLEKLLLELSKNNFNQLNLNLIYNNFFLLKENLFNFYNKMYISNYRYKDFFLKKQNKEYGFNIGIKNNSIFYLKNVYNNIFIKLLKFDFYNKKSSNFISINNEISYNSLNDIFLPQKGTKINFNIELMPIIGNSKLIELYKLQFSYDNFLKLYNDIIFHINYNIGYIYQLNNVNHLSLNDISAINYAYNIRGYPYDNNVSKKNKLIYNKYTFEVHYHTNIKSNILHNIIIIAFIDINNNYNGNLTYNQIINKINLSGGVGIKILIPLIGPISINFGLPLIPFMNDIDFKNLISLNISKYI